jgi:CBS domain-containing protein
LIEFQIDDHDAPQLASALADVLDDKGWYVDFRSRDETFVVFAGRVFRYRRGDGASATPDASVSSSSGWRRRFSPPPLSRSESTGLRSHVKRRGGTMAKSVRDAMTEDPRSIGASASVVDAARLMREEHIGSLPITDDETLVGMITDRDITTRVVAEGADPKMTSVGDVYSRDLISVEPDEDLEGALQLMARHQVRRLPVVENGRLVGIVAQADIALRENEKTGELLEAISEPSEGERR